MSRVRLVLVLGALIALGPLTIDAYLPALPDIGADLGASQATVQLTLTGTLLGLAAGQLVLGPLSDAYGRRRPMLAGICLHVLASLLCFGAPNITTLGILRIVQGFGAAAAAVITLAIVRDLFDGRAGAVLISRLMLVLGAAPILAPSLGSLVLGFTGWRGVFVVLAVFGLAILAVAYRFIGETLPPERRRPVGGVRTSVRGYRRLLADRTFVGLMLVTAMSMGALFTYVAASSFVLQGEYGLSEQAFGIVFGLGAVGLIAGTQLNAHLLRAREPEPVMRAGLLAGSLAGVALLAAALTDLGGLAGLLAPMWVVLFCMGLVMPNGTALALARHGEAAGAAAALIGAVRFGLGGLLAPLVGILGGGATPMAAVVLGCSGLGLVISRTLARENSGQRASPLAPVPSYPEASQA